MHGICPDDPCLPVRAAVTASDNYCLDTADPAIPPQEQVETRAGPESRNVQHSDYGSTRLRRPAALPLRTLRAKELNCGASQLLQSMGEELSMKDVPPSSRGQDSSHQGVMLSLKAVEKLSS